MEQAGWGKWGKQLISMVLTKFSQNTSFNSYVSDFCSSSSVHASVLLRVCHTVKEKGFQWVLMALPGEGASLSYTHTLIWGRVFLSLFEPCLTSGHCSASSAYLLVQFVARCFCSFFCKHCVAVELRSPLEV